MKNELRLSGKLMESTGVNVSHCYQCGKCTAGCALATDMDYSPSYILRLLQTDDEKNYHRVLSSEAIWLCLSCENCFARCPNEVDIPKLMDYLRQKAREESCVNPQARPVVAFHNAFLDSVKYTGRLYEVGLILGFKIRTFRLVQDLKMVPSMLLKGKLNLLPESIKSRKKIQRIFSKTIDNTK
nr:4Fe-4S dicluster domain-containing protein [uncultured Bacteroides sp.]